MRVEIECLGKRFGRVRALNGLTLGIPAGRRVALIGPNGSGKSTLTRVLLGLLSFEGTARVDGRCPLRDRDGLAPRIASVPQVAPLLSLPVSEIVRAVAAVRGIDAAAIHARAADLELDLAAVSRSPVRALSGGTRQKLFIALALAHPAGLLLLDEPTASLDAPSRQRFFRAMECHAGGATVLLCSHRLEEIRHLVDDVIALEDGRLRFQGPAADYLDRHATGVIEVRVAARNGDARELADLGFAPGRPGWWTMAVPSGRKAAVVSALLARLPDRLVDIAVRDGERLDPGTDPGTPTETDHA